MLTAVSDRQRLDEKEALLEFISSCFSATGQGEFYNTPDEQREAIFAVHKPMMAKYREFYALLLVSSINDFNKQVIIYNLLKSGKGINGNQKWTENELVYQCLNSMTPPRAYRTLAMLARMRVNNSRTRWLVEKFLGSRRDIAFDAVKYRNLIKRILEHTHIHTDSEVFDFMFGKVRSYSNKLLRTYQEAKSDPEKLYELPYTVAEGFASLHGIPRDEFLSKIQGQMTRGERNRLQESGKKAGVQIAVDWRKFDLVKLFKYLRVIDELPGDIDQIIQRTAGRIVLPEYIQNGKVALVLDNSLSASGSQEKKNHPIAVGEALSAVFRTKCSDYIEVLVNGERRGALCPVGGSTALGIAVLNAIKLKPTHLVIVSDGYENAPAGLTAQVLRAYRKINDDLKVYHFNPVFAAESESVRSLGDGIPSMGLRDVNKLSLPFFLMRAKEDVAGAIGDFEQELLALKRPVDFNSMPNKLLEVIS